MANKKTEQSPNAVVLSSGRVLEVDVYRISQREAAEMVKLSVSSILDMDGRLYELMGKMVGISGDELQDLPHPDYTKVARRCWQLIKNPVSSDPS